ncbi:glucagon-2 [Petromyzon marinus]|uniref:Glucagon n=1 Tax=Petromyzon marinus TaxID=7757 RepID=S4RMY3_PETMA|nr:glucagon-2 [Petromyzon marinus]XP_032817112.1 glucagon-2 [Petromyzon marinus]
MSNASGTLLSYMFMMLLGLTLASLVPHETDDGDLSAEISLANRHSQGSFTSDYSKHLDVKQAKDFVTWLLNTKRGGVDAQAGANLEKRHSDGSFTNDMNVMLDRMSAKNFLEWLKQQGRG